MPTALKRIILSPGEPAGIGPDIIIQIAQQSWPAELMVVGDPTLFAERAQLLKLPLPPSLKIIPVSLNTTCHPGVLDKKNASYVIECLKIATDHCLQQKNSALVTGPIHKGILNEAGISFQGHTEFLADYCHAQHVVMLFVTPKMKVAVATTHIPLSAVPKAITPEKLTLTLRTMHRGLIDVFKCSNPKILVCGLNPHAGENGHFGREEIDVIEPTLAALRAENINAIGPLSADTIFTEKYLTTADAILAMYHDQALPVVKFSGFKHAVNITLGLPIIRTSVDHGTALDVAGSQQADPGSLAAAIRLAIELC